jgi:hypothetical protein
MDTVLNRSAQKVRIVNRSSVISDRFKLAPVSFTASECFQELHCHIVQSSILSNLPSYWVKQDILNRNITKISPSFVLWRNSSTYFLIDRKSLPTFAMVWIYM